MGEDSSSEGLGHRLLDGHFSHRFDVKIVIMFV